MNIEYAMKNGQLTHVAEVERGLKCDCVCPGCGEKMIARKGLKKAHHFAHQNAECAHGVETTLHLMAKAILEKEKQILLPEVTVPFEHRHSIISEATTVKFDEVFLEKRLDDIIPDVLLKIGDKLLIIEIRVTHKFDDDKRKKIEDSGISTLEIDLSDFDRMITLEDLRKILLEETKHKRWTYNRLSMYYKQKWLSVCEAKPTIERGCATHVDFCPINMRTWHGKSYANVIDDCLGCEFMADIICDDKKEVVYCSGKANIKSVSDLKNFLTKPTSP